MSVGVRLTEQLGSWRTDGAINASSDSPTERELREEVGFTVRVGTRVQLGILVPLVQTWKDVGEESSSGGGFGDTTASGRLLLLSPSFSELLPSVSLTFSALLPTGRATRQSEDSLVADVTGYGFGELRPGLSLEKTWSVGWFATMGGSVGFRTAYYEKTGAYVHPSPRLQIYVGGGPTWHWGFSLTLGGVFERESGASIDGEIAPGTTRYRTALFAVAAYDLSEEWTASADVQVDPPIDGFGRNEPVSLSPSLGLRYVWPLHH